MIGYPVRAASCWVLASVVLFLFATASAPAQPRDDERNDNDRYSDYDSEPPYDYYERHWRRQARDYGRARDRHYRRYRDDYYRNYRPWQRYPDDGWYRQSYYGDEVFDRTYWEGRRDGRRYAEWERRHELGRRSYDDAMSEGLLAFRNAEYSSAVRSFVRAAKINQGDPASRIHAAHAMVAIERYAEALPALRRAFQLQPKIAYLALDIRRDYGPKSDFDVHLKQLETAARADEDDPALWLLLGYYQFYSGREGDALKSLGKADALAPGDFMTKALLEAARRIAPAYKAAPTSSRTEVNP